METVPGKRFDNPYYFPDLQAQPLVPLTLPITMSSPIKASLGQDLNKENYAPASSFNTMKVSKDPSFKHGKRRPSACVFVASLRATRSDDELCRSVTDHFSAFGELASVKVLRDPVNRPYAFVQYTNDRDCQKAIKMGHNSELDGRKLRCEAAKVNRTLFISFFQHMGRLQLQELASQYGEIEIITPSTHAGRVVSGPVPDASLNWFIKYSYRDDAIRAFASLSESEEYHVEWAQNIDDVGIKPLQFDKLSIFIGQLPADTTEESIRQHFSVHGEIVDVSVIQKGTSTFSFVTFTDEAAAASAVARDNHSMFMNKTIHVQYKEISSKGNSRVILSPRVPVALAPPPIHLRKRFSGIFQKWPANGRQGPYDVYPNATMVDKSEVMRNSQDFFIPPSNRDYHTLDPRVREGRKFSAADHSSLYYFIPASKHK